MERREGGKTGGEEENGDDTTGHTNIFCSILDKFITSLKMHYLLE